MRSGSRSRINCSSGPTGTDARESAARLALEAKQPGVIASLELEPGPRERAPGRLVVGLDVGDQPSHGRIDQRPRRALDDQLAPEAPPARLGCNRHVQLGGVRRLAREPELLRSFPLWKKRSACSRAMSCT